MPPKVDPKERLERERARIRARSRTVELGGLGVVVSLTVLPFLLAKFLPSLWAFIVSIAAMLVCVGVIAWAVVDRRRALREM